MILDLVFVAVSALFLYGLYAAQGIFPGDAGDLVAAAITRGVPHPPGYPLYTALGWLVTRIPVLTPAWRMAWLSIVPHVAVLILVYLFTYRLTKHRVASLFASATLAGNYLFFLYSTTPEVFALLDLFVIGLLFLGVVLRTKFRTRTFAVFCLGIGLSFTHHPFVLLLFPSLFFLLRPTFIRLRHRLRYGVIGAGSFMVGLLPYWYIGFAAVGTSIINWDRPTTFARFMRLIARSDYGSFMSGGIVGHSLYERWLNVKAYFVFLVVDYTWIGVFLAVVGLLWLWKHHRDIAIAFVGALLLLGPGFSFYSSFSIVNRFVLGTVERFALPSYILLAPLVGMGVVALCRGIAVRLSFLLRTPTKRQQLSALLLSVFFVYPLTVGGMNIWRFYGLSTDHTADTYAEDILSSAPPRAIVFLTRDTPLFSVEYMRYARRYRNDILVLHTARMNLPDYHEVIHMFDGSVVMPQEGSVTEAYLIAFIKANRELRPIASNDVIPVSDGWVWVPHGLLYVLTPISESQTDDEVIATNAALWQSFQNPRLGLLSRYNHLFLTNVLDEYGIMSTEYGKYLLKKNRLSDAKNQFERTISYGSDTQNATAWMYRGLTDSLMKDCNGALSAFEKAKQPLYSPNAALLYYKAVTYRDCVGDVSRANELFSQYQAANRQTEQPLEGPQ